MPGGDGTGPNGMGPMTGRAAGYCAGFEMPGYVNPVAGRGIRFGRGRGGFGSGGRGRRNMFYATGLPGWMRYANPVIAGQVKMPDTEKEALKHHAASLQAQLDVISKRLSELENSSETR